MSSVTGSLLFLSFFFFFLSASSDCFNKESSSDRLISTMAIWEVKQDETFEIYQLTSKKSPWLVTVFGEAPCCNLTFIFSRLKAVAVENPVIQ